MNPDDSTVLPRGLHTTQLHNTTGIPQVRRHDCDPCALLNPHDTNPTNAGVYDYLVGGTFNTPADRHAADAAQRQFPAAETAVANQNFLQRAVQFMAHNGIGQFLDLGCGYPNDGSVYAVARRARPGARVICVDHDPLVCRIMDDTTLDTDRVETIYADIIDAATVLRDYRLRTMFDTTKPIGIIMGAVLDLLADDVAPDGVAGLVARYLRFAPPGSYLAISHAAIHPTAPSRHPGDRHPRYPVEAIGIRYPRTQEEIRGLFGTATLISANETDGPALVRPQHWQPTPDSTEDADSDHRYDGYALCGVAQKHQTIFPHHVTTPRPRWD